MQRIRRYSPGIGQLVYGVGVEHVGRDLPKRKKVYQKMLEKKGRSKAKHNELEQTTQSIHYHQESTVTATTGTATATATPVAMPRYVNVDGTVSIDNGNSSSNNNDQHNDNEDDSDN